MPSIDQESSSDSDYEVEAHIKAKRRRKPINDDTADLLGNFDDVKRKEIIDGTYVEKHSTINPSDEEEEEELDEEDKTSEKEDNSDESNSEEDDADDVNGESADSDEVNTNLSKDQLCSLMQGTSKANRHVLYVTNLNFETSREDLENIFGAVGTVKSIRIPKKRRGGFAFVEMADMDSFQKGFQLHNTEIQGRKIKVQLSEAGKKKSANKKNIIKQKNRKLAEMRNEQKAFTKSGKFFDKTLKKEKAKEMLARKRWRKPKTGPRPS